MFLWTEDIYIFYIYICVYINLYIYNLCDEWSALAAHSPRDQKVVMLFLTANQWQKLLFNNRHKE